VGRVNLNDVMDELASALAGVTGLRVFGYPPPTIVPPAGVVSYPEAIDYDQTYGRGMDKISKLPIIVIVGKANDKAARNTAAGWAAGSGSTSIKQALESHGYSSCDDVSVTECGFDVISVGAIDYVATTFMLDIVGRGA
jgi:hypothetical protein